MREYKRYEEYKDSGVEWVDKIPEDWKVVKLKFITECLDNLRVPLNSTERAEMKGDIPYWGANSIVDYVNDWLVDGEVILLGEDGAPFFDKLKNVAFYSNEKIWPNNHVHVLRVNNQNEIKFLIYSLNITDYTAFITGSTRDKLNQSAMSEIPLQLPSQNEQQKIASFLDQKTAEIDEIISKKETLIDHFEKYKKSVITEAVTKGKLGNKYLNEDGELVDELEMKDSGVEWIGETPKYYNLLQLRRVINKFVDYRGKTPDKTDKGIPLITAKNIYNGKVSHESSPEFIAKKDYDSWMTRGMPEQGDVLITTEAPLGKTAQIKNEKIALAQRIILFKVDFNYITNDYLKYHFLSSFGQDELWIKATGSTALGIKASKLRGTRIFVPSLYSQDKITNYLDKKTHQINMIIQKTKQSIEKYKEYKKSLIFEAVTGKIDLRDYELEGGEEFAEHNNSSETERKRLSAVD